jgi:hypothetical protein
MKLYFLSLLKDTPKLGYWDYAILEDIFKGLELQEHEVSQIPVIKNPFNQAIVVVPSRSHAAHVKQINVELNKLSSVVLFLMGDEESVFPVEEIKHNNIKIWVQNPKPGRHDQYRKLGCGYTPHIKGAKEIPKKELNWFFSGQINNDRRRECCSALKELLLRNENLISGYLGQTPGFSLGLSKDEYIEKMLQAKVAPCPSGSHTVDTFRLFEALELGCVPIADNETPMNNWSGFWTWLFDEEPPFPTINRYDDLGGYIQDSLEKFPVLNNKIQSWWLRKKSQYRQTLRQDLDDLGFNLDKKPVSAVIPISPIPSHPETHILEETVASVRRWLPKATIYLTFDGVRAENEEMRTDYNEHIRRVLWKSRFWGDVQPIIFDEHLHQVGMMRQVIDNIDTPVILYVEQDTPLVTDEHIEVAAIVSDILRGDSNVIRLHHEGVIPKEHNHLMIGEPQDCLQKTVQWSQRPHFASKAFYRRVLSENFSKGANCFIEDLLHGKIQDSFNKDGVFGWEQWRLHIYHPPTGNIKRSYHTDGREGAKKYDESQIW